MRPFTYKITDQNFDVITVTKFESRPKLGSLVLVDKVYYELVAIGNDELDFSTVLVAKPYSKVDNIKITTNTILFFIMMVFAVHLLIDVNMHGLMRFFGYFSA